MTEELADTRENLAMLTAREAEVRAMTVDELLDLLDIDAWEDTNHAETWRKAIKALNLILLYAGEFFGDRSCLVAERTCDLLRFIMEEDDDDMGHAFIERLMWSNTNKKAQPATTVVEVQQ